MELIVRAYTGSGAAADLVADVDDSHRVGDLAGALGAQLGVHDPDPTITLLRAGVVLDPGGTVAGSGLVSGDDLVVGAPYPVTRVPAIPVRAVTIDVLTGPDTGTSLILLQGAFSVGRDPASRVALTDPTVSRHHLDVVVATDWTVTVAPAEEVENPVRCNGEVITEALVVGPDDIISMGATRLAFRPFVRAPGERIDQLGQIEFHRTPYRPPVVAERRAADIGRVPERPEPRRFQVLTAVAPLGAGLTMFAFSGQPQFLALTLMSPLVVVANWIEDRRSGKRRFRRQQAEFKAAVERRHDELTELVEEERIERLHAAPDVAELARRAELRTADLWARGRDAPDLLRLRVGLGTVATIVDAPLKDGGDDELRQLALDAAAGSRRVDGVPITVDLADSGVLGVHGALDVVSGVAAALVLQASCLHSPEDLTIVAALGVDRPFAASLKWLPHLRSVTSPLAGDHVAHSTAEADDLVGRLLEIVERRAEASQRDHSRSNRTHWPWVLAIVDGRLEPDPAAMADLLDRGPDNGISVIWLAEAAAEIPRQARFILAAHSSGTSPEGTLWATDPEIANQQVEIEQVRADIADRVMRSLAPIRDASTASLATSIPRTVPLLDVLDVPRPSPDAIIEQWRRRRGDALPFPIGTTADGPLTLDLVADGPHSLIGGTSGAGKSELLQSIVASLAVNHPPTRLNFLFIDYKGGAASAVFNELPHTVGYVTNLSAELSLRALTSLRAELDRRMQMMEGRAKDLREMRELHPDEAPASLVIVVDEFATLVREVPAFVDGVVDIAQRGRSLGIHLILATQRPTGSVNDNILANTNLRISLRMLDRAESNAVIGSGDAAEIPVPLKGRGYARLGPRQLVPFQAAFCGAPLTSDTDEAPVLVAPFVHTDDSPKVAGASVPEHGTQLAAVLGAIRTANGTLGLSPPARPWRDVLPERLTLDDVRADPRAAAGDASPGRLVVVGLRDAPEQQDQFPAVIDLEAGGGWLVFGSGGSGKTTVLRTVAVSAVTAGGPDDVAIVAFDFASRALGSLHPLPQVVDVATGDDLEAVTRLIALLDAELDRRRLLLATARAENLTAYNRAASFARSETRSAHEADSFARSETRSAHEADSFARSETRSAHTRHDPLPRVLVLVDGFGGLVSSFTGGGGITSAVPLESWLERFNNLVTEGRQVGIHTVATADRRASVPSRLHAAVGNRLVMRHADESGYAEHGVAGTRARGLELEPGRGLWQADGIVQVATVSADPSAEAQAATIAEIAARLPPPQRPILRSRPLPDHIALAELERARRNPYTFPLGVADVSSATVAVDLTWSHLAVCGPPRSGRTTVLATAAAGLHPDHDVWLAAPSAIGFDPRWFAEVGTGRAPAVAPLLEQLVSMLEADPPRRPQVLLVDDIDTLDDAVLSPLWERVAKADGLHLVASLEARSMSGYTTNPVINLLRRSRRLLQLQPDDASEVFQVTGLKAPIRPGVRMVPGRGVYVADRVPQVVQVAEAGPVAPS